MKLFLLLVYVGSILMLRCISAFALVQGGAPESCKRCWRGSGRREHDLLRLEREVFALSSELCSVFVDAKSLMWKSASMRKKSANALEAVFADSAVLTLFLVSLFHLKPSVCVDVNDCMCVWKCVKREQNGTVVVI